MQTTFPRSILNQFVLSAIFSLVLAASVFGAATVDGGYFPVVSKALASDTPMQPLVQPDGKVVIWGSNFVVDGIGKSRVVRLNVDGTLDPTFTYCECVTTIYSVGLLPDGKFIAAGAGVTGHSRVVRLNSDGSLDPGFTAAFSGYQYSNASYLGAAPDGKIYVTHGGGLGSGFHSASLMRLNMNGSQDTTFANIFYDNGRNIWGYARGLAILSSGKMYFATASQSGPSTSGFVRRYNSDGTIDSTWEAPNIGSFGNTINSLSLQADESLLMGGSFPSVNGVARPNLVRLAPAGNVDVAFTPPATMGIVSQLAALPNGKVLYMVNSRLARLNSDGSADATFNHPTEISTVRSVFALAPMDRIVVAGLTPSSTYRLFRLNSGGDVDISYEPNVTVYGQVSATASQSNSKSIIAGTFSRIGLVARAGIARLNADGTLDTSFEPGTGFNQVPYEVAVQTDGRILVSGNFSNFNGMTVGGLVRLEANGMLDATFAPAMTEVYGALLQPDGKVLAFGGFGTVNGVTKQRVVRFNSDGTIDNTFNAQIASGWVYSVEREADGKYIVGGAFTGVDGFNRSNLVRLNANGSIDQSFNATNVGAVRVVRKQQSGKYVWLSYNNITNGLFRRNSDGSADATFYNNSFLGYSDPSYSSLVMQDDGSLVVGGNFYSVNGASRNNIARFDLNGRPDPLFFPTGANGRVSSLSKQTDGKVIVGGSFTSIENITRTGVARIEPGLLTRTTNFDFDGDGRADVSVFRASEGRWYILQSADLTMRQVNFAIAGDIPTPADFDGDGKTDVAIYRPSNGDWWSLSSITGQQINGSFGQTGGIPLPSDFNGDGRADYIIYRSTTGYWSRLSSANAQPSDRSFGAVGDKPVIADFNGDGMVDPAIYRPSDGNWWWMSSADGVQRATKWGLAEDKAVPADYTGDGRSDLGIFRPSTGVWYIYDLANAAEIIYPFGTNGDRPVSADFDGDGRADTSVFRPSDGIWYLLRSTSGYTGFQWGIATDAAVPNVYVPQ